MADKNGNPIGRHGISLTELVIVVSIIGILASIVAVRFNSSTEYAQLQHAANTLLTDLRLVRDQARTDQQSYTFLVDPVSCSYQAPGVSALKGPTDITVDLRQAPYRISVVTCNLGGDNFIQFNAEGMPDQTGSIVLRRGSKQALIEITKRGSIDPVE